MEWKGNRRRYRSEGGKNIQINTSCLPFVKRITSISLHLCCVRKQVKKRWGKREERERKKEKKKEIAEARENSGKRWTRGSRCFGGGWNTIGRFVKNSCATGHLLSWREMKVHEIITPGWWWRMIENIFFSTLYIFLFSFFPFLVKFDLSRFRMSRWGAWREVAGETHSLSLSLSLSFWSSARTTVIDVKRACSSREDRQLRQMFDYYFFFGRSCSRIVLEN